MKKIRIIFYCMIVCFGVAMGMEQETPASINIFGWFTKQKQFVRRWFAPTLFFGAAIFCIVAINQYNRTAKCY